MKKRVHYRANIIVRLFRLSHVPPGLLGFENETVTLVAIHEAGSAAAIGVVEGDAAFIDITIEGAVFLVHVGWREAQTFAQAVDEGLVSATFRPA